MGCGPGITGRTEGLRSSLSPKGTAGSFWLPDQGDCFRRRRVVRRTDRDWGGRVAPAGLSYRKETFEVSGCKRGQPSEGRARDSLQLRCPSCRSRAGVLPAGFISQRNSLHYWQMRQQNAVQMSTNSSVAWAADTLSFRNTYAPRVCRKHFWFRTLLTRCGSNCWRRCSAASMPRCLDFQREYDHFEQISACCT